MDERSSLRRATARTPSALGLAIKCDAAMVKHNFVVESPLLGCVRSLAAWPSGEPDLIRNARPWASGGAPASGAPDLGPAVVDIRLRAALRGNAAAAGGAGAAGGHGHTAGGTSGDHKK